MKKLIYLLIAILFMSCNPYVERTKYSIRMDYMIIDNSKHDTIRNIHFNSMICAGTGVPSYMIGPANLLIITSSNLWSKNIRCCDCRTNDNIVLQVTNFNYSITEQYEENIITNKKRQIKTYPN